MNDPRYPYMTYDEIIAAEKREQAQTEAYADGRADERAEWVPVLEALRSIHEITEEEWHVRTDSSRLTEIRGMAAVAIEKAGG